MKSIQIVNSDEVFAPLGSPETFYRGKWQEVKITEVGKDADVPFEVRKSLVGLTVPTIFHKTQLDLQGVDLPIPENSRLSYCIDVIEVLKSSNKLTEAEILEAVALNPLDMYVFEDGTYELYSQK